MSLRAASLILALGALSSSSALGAIRNTFSAPTGDLGANLSTDPTQISRMHGEISYFTTSQNSLTGHALTLTLGGGYKVSRDVELVLGLAGEGIIQASGGATADQFAIGNALFGANYVKSLSYQLRLKIGGALALGPWNQSDGTFTSEGGAQALAGTATHAFQDAWYFDPLRVHVLIPARVEYDVGESFVLTADIQGDLGFGLSGTKSGFLFIFAPGAALWTSDMFVLGLRAPLQFQTYLSDAAQVSLEPFVRFELGETGFLSTRFTMNLDEPYGFSFDSGRVWGLHVALGGAF